MHSGSDRLAQRCCVTRVDLLRRAHCINAGKVDAIQLNSTHPLARESGQFTQMLGTTLRNSIRKCSDTRVIKTQGDTLDLYEGKALRVLQAKINPAFFLTIRHFTLECGEAIQLGNHPRQ